MFQPTWQELKMRLFSTHSFIIQVYMHAAHNCYVQSRVLFWHGGVVGGCDGLWPSSLKFGHFSWNECPQDACTQPAGETSFSKTQPGCCPFERGSNRMSCWPSGSALAHLTPQGLAHSSVLQHRAVVKPLTPDHLDPFVSTTADTLLYAVVKVAVGERFLHMTATFLGPHCHRWPGSHVIKEKCCHMHEWGGGLFHVIPLCFYSAFLWMNTLF